MIIRSTTISFTYLRLYMKKRLESWQDNKEKLTFVTCLWPNKKERNDFYSKILIKKMADSA